MSAHIKLEITIDEKTYEKINDIVNYSKLRQRYMPEHDFPLTHEEVVKSAVFQYFRKLDLIYSTVIDRKKYNLKKSTALRNNIKDYIKDVKGIKQKDLSDMTGIDPAAISNILSNRNQPSMDYFLRIWIALGCPPIEDLFYRDAD